MPSLRSRTCALLLLCLLLAGTIARAQEAPERRPRIGLVLGGGGARGAAHIGVLQVLMEQNVPIDLVVGTSMGAVIGALHCIGENPDEIEATLLGVDWDDLFTDRPNRTQRSFRRKQDDSAEFLPMEWGWKNRIVLASGAFSGQKLGFAFRDPALYLLGDDGFDNLSTPFRAVSTDLLTGEKFVPDHGNLMKAVRASMSIPGVFPPVNWDGHFLVDGYLARNLPVDVARAMGADIVIAVDVGVLPNKANTKKFRTIGGVNEQAGYIGARQNVDPMLEQADIVIQPNLAGISTRDFKKVRDAIGPGREATMAVIEQLQSLSLSPNAYLEHVRQHRPTVAGHPVIDSIELINDTVTSDAAILANIHQPLGQKLDLDLLKQDLTRIYDFGVFNLLDFEVRNSGEKHVLIVTASPKYYAPNILNFGASYAGGNGGRSSFTLRTRWTRSEMNALGAELRTDALLGQTNNLQSEFYQPLTMQRGPFFAVRGRYEYSVDPWYFRSRQLSEIQITRLDATADLGLRLKHYGEFRMGLLYGHLTVTDKIGGIFGSDESDIGGFTASLGFDMLDVPVLPHHGWKAAVRYYNGRHEFGGGPDYQRLIAAGSLSASRGDHTIRVSLKGGSDFHTNMPEFDMFTLGGLDNLSGLDEKQLRGNVFSLGKLAWYKRIAGGASPYATSWYIVAQLEAGNAWRWSPDPSLDAEYGKPALNDLLYSGLVAVVGTSFAGPFSLSYGRTRDGHDAVYLGLGVLRPFVD